MRRKLLSILLVLAVVAGLAGTAVSVGLVISAVQFYEWGRVVLHSVTTAVCVEMMILALEKLKNKENS